MAADTPGWRRYRRRRIRRGLLAGTVPMPAKERRRAELLQVAADAARRAEALRSRQGFRSDPAAVAEADRLAAESRAALALAVPGAFPGDAVRLLTEGMDEL